MPLTLSWRIGVAHYETDAAFDELMVQVAANLDWLDEVAFFETVTHHLYLPLEAFAQRTDILARRLRAIKQAGVKRAGINVLTTIGHLDEARDTMPPLPFQGMVGPTGAQSTGCACPNTPELRAYVRAKYALVAAAGPDFVWIDDDIRMNNHGVSHGCFCPTCLAILSRTLGHTFDREELLAALDDPARGDVRAAWVQQNADTLAALLADVADAIHAVDPNIATGLMTAGAGDLYAGADLPRWMRALRATKLRPGGGFYSDAAPAQMIGKALDVGRGTAAMADSRELTDIQYELENFPYQKLRKSATALVSECTLALATGCDGVAFNMLPMWGGPFDDCAAFLPAIRSARAGWRELAAHAAGLPTAGLWPAWHPKLWARRSLEAGQSWLGTSGDQGASLPYCLTELGLPLSVAAWEGGAPPPHGTVLAGRVAEAFSDDELRALLSGGVLLDTTALAILAERGLGDLTGVQLALRRDNGLMERFTADPLNGRHAGQVRDARIEFWGDARGKGDSLAPVGPGVRILAELEDYLQRPCGACLTAFENELGGRVAVMGYAPWMFLQSVAKRAQLVALADWLTRGTLPVVIDEAVPLVPFVRLGAARDRAAVVLLNAGLDPIAQADVRVRLAAGEQTVAVRDLPPWTTRVLLLGAGCP